MPTRCRVSLSSNSKRTPLPKAQELAAGSEKLGLGVPREPRVRAGAVHDERSPHQTSTELLADLIRDIERLERLRDRPEVENHKSRSTRLPRRRGDVMP